MKKNKTPYSNISDKEFLFKFKAVALKLLRKYVLNIFQHF